MSFQTGHCYSYYTATVNFEVNYPRLEGMIKADVCIIGAGFTGLSTAIELAERGYKVVVIEGKRVGWGASGRNGGQLIGGFSGADEIVKRLGSDVVDMIWDMGWAGNDIVRQRIDKYKIDCDLKYGHLEVAVKPRHVAALEASLAEYERRNFPHKFRMVTEQEIRHVLGTDAYIGGLINMGSGHLHPLNLCLGEAKAAENLGVMIFEHTPALDIISGEKAKVIVKSGIVEADFVVLAGNAYHRLGPLFPQLNGVLFPVGSFMMATEPLSEEIAARINPLDLAVCDRNFLVDYFRLSADRRLLFGGRCNFDVKKTDRIRATLVPRMLKIYPQLADIRIDFEWSGNIGVTLNKVPQLGRLAPNVFYAQGYSGHGVNFSHLAGHIMADAIAGVMERLDIFERIKPVRLPVSPWVGDKISALGMIYYALRDRMG